MAAAVSMPVAAWAADGAEGADAAETRSLPVVSGTPPAAPAEGAAAMVAPPAGFDSRAYIERAAELVEAGRGELARTYLEPALIDFRLHPGERSRAYYLRGYSFYAEGMYVSAFKDYNRALEFHPGNPVVLTAVAHLYLEGLGVEQNPELAVGFFQQAVEAEHPPASLRLGTAYLRGIGVAQDLDAARRLLGQAAEAGLAQAMLHLAQSYREPYADPPQPEQARTWYRKAQEAGAPDALAYLGFMAEDGEGGEPDLEAARDFFRQAAEAGSAVGQAKLAHLYLTGEGVEEDARQARALFQQAADQGHPAGFMGLGFLYETGTGVAQDDAQANLWYERAADAGLLDAQLRMAHHSLSGDDLTSHRRAGDWLARAAAQNSPRALNDYAWLLATSPFAEVRNGPQAVTLALQAVSRDRNASYLDTLAAAYAETGKFDHAVTTQREALAAADGADARVIAELESHLKAFESGEPWRE